MKKELQYFPKNSSIRYDFFELSNIIFYLDFNDTSTFSDTNKKNQYTILMQLNSFEGNYKSRRTISLGGKRQQKNKETLLKKNQAQRRARGNEKLKLKSAIKIQVLGTYI